MCGRYVVKFDQFPPNSSIRVTLNPRAKYNYKMATIELEEWRIAIKIKVNELHLSEHDDEATQQAENLFQLIIAALIILSV